MLSLKIWPFDPKSSYTLIEYTVYVPLSELGPPPPLSQVKGWGSPNSDDCKALQSVYSVIWPLAKCKKGSLQLTRVSNVKRRRLRYSPSLVRGRLSSKQTNKIFGSNRNKPKQDLFWLCFGLFRETEKKNSVCFGLFRCFEPISNRLKQTELFQKEPKQP